MEMCSKLDLHYCNRAFLDWLQTVAYSSGHVAERVSYSSHLFHYTHYSKDKEKKKSLSYPNPLPPHPSIHESLITSAWENVSYMAVEI